MKLELSEQQVQMISELYQNEIVRVKHSGSYQVIEHLETMLEKFKSEVEKSKVNE